MATPGDIWDGELDGGARNPGSPSADIPRVDGPNRFHGPPQPSIQTLPHKLLLQSWLKCTSHQPR
jgi:hypothetical protein